MKIKKILTFLLTLVHCLVITGCWDRNEVDKLAIVVALGIDKIPGPEPFLLTAQIVNPSATRREGGGGKDKPFFLATSKGESIDDAVRKFMQFSPRRFFFSHTAIIVFGDKLARSGIWPTMDYIAREREFRRSIWVLVTPKTAQEILQSSLELEKIPALGIESMILQSKKSSIVQLVQRKDFIRDITSPTHSAVISSLDLISKKSDLDKGQQNQTEEGRNLQLKGEAVFKKGKLVGYLTDGETRGRLWMLGEMKQGPVIFPCHRDNGKVVLNMSSKKSQITPSVKNGKIKMTIHVESEGVIKEATCPKLQVENMETISELEKLSKGKIEEEVKMALQKAQHVKADILGFGNQIYRDYPEQWASLEKNWDQTFSRMEVEIHVTSIIRQLGVIRGPLNIENE